MKRVNVVVEGYSELRFVQQTLNKHFNGAIQFGARCVLTSRDRSINYEYRGGLSKYQHAKDDIIRWLLSDADAYVSTMFDFYALPRNFPGYEQSLKLPTHLQQVQFLEQEMKKDILSDSRLKDMFPDRFIPYIQLHEFESLLYTDIRVLLYDYLDAANIKGIDALYDATKDIPPEDINNGLETAPSKRLKKAVDNYPKGDAPADWLETIGIGNIKSKCPHFSAWLEKLEGI